MYTFSENKEKSFWKRSIVISEKMVLLLLFHKEITGKIILLVVYYIVFTLKSMPNFFPNCRLEEDRRFKS